MNDYREQGGPGGYGLEGRRAPFVLRRRWDAWWYSMADVNIAWFWSQVAQYAAVKAAREAGWPWPRWVVEMEVED